MHVTIQLSKHIEDAVELIQLIYQFAADSGGGGNEKEGNRKWMPSFNF